MSNVHTLSQCSPYMCVMDCDRKRFLSWAAKKSDSAKSSTSAAEKLSFLNYHAHWVLGTTVPRTFVRQWAGE